MESVEVYGVVKSIEGEKGGMRCFRGMGLLGAGVHFS